MSKTKNSILIYCDESVSKGKYYADFYGGLLVFERESHAVIKRLEKAKAHLNLGAEIKWGKVTHQYVSKYMLMMDAFFKELHHNKVKIRIMFRQTAVIPKGIAPHKEDQKFFMLYYQFIKHAFGLRYYRQAHSPDKLHLRLFFDELPDKTIKNEIFKNNIYGLQSLEIFNKINLVIDRDDIAEVDSSKHILMQCLDIVLGAMAFRLNDKHKEKPEGAKRRAKRTVAKEKLYKHILSHIRQTHNNFNIGISTGRPDGPDDLWKMPYRHWCFLPKNFEIDDELYK